MSRPKGLSLDSGRPNRVPTQDSSESEHPKVPQSKDSSRAARASSVGALLSHEPPVSILGKSRKSSGASSGSSHGSRHSVKFCEPEWEDGERRFSESSTTSTSSSVASCFRYRSFDIPSQASIPESPDESDPDLPYSPEKLSLNEFLTLGSSNSSASAEASSKSMSTSSSSIGGISDYQNQPSVKPKVRSTSRPPDLNTMIASFELKVPCLVTPMTKTGDGKCNMGPVSPACAGRLSPMPAFAKDRGLTILSPHNPPPELHFGSSITLRTRKGKTIVLPKLRMPFHDSAFLG